MKKKIIIISSFILLIAAGIITFLLLNKKDIIELKNANISHDRKFGGVFVEEQTSDFNKLGFKFGDSVNNYLLSSEITQENINLLKSKIKK